MNVELASLVISVALLVLNGFSLYVQSQTKNWVLERFVLKKDFMDMLELWIRPRGSRPE